MNNSSNRVHLSLNIGDQLTSISCGHVVVELIKFIAYQRLQIPYTYQWLKQVINRKKTNEDEDIKESYQSERHFRTASTALENLDFILKSLLLEINGPSLPEEVCIALGPTPVTCKEVYRLLLPVVCHKPQCHSTAIASDHKVQRNVFRSLATSEKLSHIFFSQIPPTNMYVFIKKKLVGNIDSIVNCDNFVFTNGCRLPRNSKIVVINFRNKNLDNVVCCNDFHVYGDVINQSLENLKLDDEDKEMEFDEIESTDTLKWYQSSYVMKGFKDAIVNGVSVTNSWCSNS